MKRSTDRLLTTHVGSLPRPGDLLDLMKARLSGQPYDQQAYAGSVNAAVAGSVKRQAQIGIDIVSDGEQSKRGFFPYVSERLAGFEGRPGASFAMFGKEVAAFPEYYKQYFAQAMIGGAVAPLVPMVCTGPVSYIGQEALQTDIANLKAAVQSVPVEEVFMPAVAPSGVGSNEFYGSEEEFLIAVADALHVEYQAIVDAGFILQVDDPFLVDMYSFGDLSPTERRGKGQLYVDAVNRALRGIPADRVRFHTCYSINEGPRIFDAPLKEYVDLVLQVQADAFSFEAANPRHEHEYHVWEDVKLPDGKVLIPGVITHASNIVEHPEYIAERLLRYTRIVGRENVIAGADCGFSSMATYNPEVHETVMWAKFEAMAEGARLASKQLW